MVDQVRQGLIVAVVDDDQRQLQSLESLLQSAGYSVRLFDSAQTLLESDSLKEIDYLISDVRMPAMDGLELSRIAHAIRPGLPIILITGRLELLTRSPPIVMKYCRLFTKPFNGEALLMAMSDDLHGRRPTLKP